MYQVYRTNNNYTLSMKGPAGGGSAHLLRLWSTGSGAWLQRTTLSRTVTDVEIIRLI